MQNEEVKNEKEKKEKKKREKPLRIPCRQYKHKFSTICHVPPEVFPFLLLSALCFFLFAFLLFAFLLFAFLLFAFLLSVSSFSLKQKNSLMAVAGKRFEFFPTSLLARYPDVS